MMDPPVTSWPIGSSVYLAVRLTMDRSSGVRSMRLLVNPNRIYSVFLVRYSSKVFLRVKFTWVAW